MAPKRSFLGDIYRERQAVKSHAHSSMDSTSEFEMVPHQERPEADTDPGIPATGVADDGDMDVDEPFGADFSDDKMEQDNFEVDIEELEHCGITNLELMEQAKKTGAQIELDTNKNLCWNCCRPFKKSELLPLTPT